MSAPALILVDFQLGFDAPIWGARNNPGAEETAARLLSFWRAQSRPVFHVQHVSVEPGSPLGPASGTMGFKPDVAPLPGEPVIQKNVNSAFIGTDLEAQLRALEVTKVVICGLTTPHCVSTTTRMAANLGFETQVVHDACAAVAMNADASWRAGLDAPTPQEIHDAALTHLHGEFSQVIAASDILGAP